MSPQRCCLNFEALPARAMGSALNLVELSAQSRLLKFLYDAWPDTATMQPIRIGLSDEDGDIAFLRAVQDLCDHGLIGYEALVRDAQGPRVIDASITTRGRAILNRSDLDLRREQPA